MSSPTDWATAPSASVSLKPTSNGRRVVGWAVDLIVVAALVGVVYVVGLIRINGCDTWNPATQQFGGSCPFAQTREVPRADGSIDLVYVLSSGRELPADHPTVKTVLLGTRVVDPPSKATYLVGLGYVLLVFVVLQGLTGWTPGKALAGTRLVRVPGKGASGGDQPASATDGARPPGIVPALVRWVIPDGAIGLVGLVFGLTSGPWFLRLLASDGALGLFNAIACLVGGGLTIGDRAAGTMVVDERFFAHRRGRRQAEKLEKGQKTPTEGRPAEAAEPVATATGGAAATGTSDWQAGWPTPAAPAPPAAPAGAPDPQPAPYAGTAAAPGAAQEPSTAWLAGTPEPANAAQATPQPTVPSDWQPPWQQTTGDWTASQPASGELWPPPREGSEQLAPAHASRHDLESAAAASPATAADNAAGAPAGHESGTEATGETPAPTFSEPELPQWLDRDPAEAATAHPDVLHPESVAGRHDRPDDTAEVPTPVAQQGSPAPASAAAPQWEVAPPLWDPPVRTGDHGRDVSPPPDFRAAPEPAAVTTRATATAAAAREPRWDETRQAYIFWDDSRQEWLQFDYESQQWGPISRA